MSKIKQISIAIDTWDDIFSDFDPSPLSYRTLSEDFLRELTKRYRETKSGQFIVMIYAPLKLKRGHKEKIIVRRIRDYFDTKYQQKRGEVRKYALTGGLMLLTGLTVIIGLYFLRSTIASELLLPLGWFGAWEGISKVFNILTSAKQELDIENKFSNASYEFYYE